MSSNRRRPHPKRLPLTREEKRALAAIPLAAIALGAIGYVSWKHDRAPAPKTATSTVAEPERSASSPTLTPRAGLEVQTLVERRDGLRRIVLTYGGGEAVLTLGPLGPDGKGEGTFVAESSAKGAAFLEAFARWFSEPLAPARTTPTPLEPLKVRYVRLAPPTSRAPEAFRLALSSPRRRAEIFFNLFPDGTRATFLERGRPEARPVLMAVLAEGLRDGPKPPRTQKTDPNMSSETPLATSVRPLLPGPVVAAACGDHGFYAAEKDGWHTKVVALPSASSTARTITTIDGVLEGLVGSPDGKQLALLFVHAANAEQIQPEDARELRIIDVATGATVPFFNADEGFRGTGLPIWSPKQVIVLEGRLPTTSPGERVARAYGAAPPSFLGETKAQLRLRPTRFEGDQVVLGAWEVQPRIVRHTFLWTLGSAPVLKEAIPFTAPDSRFIFHVEDDKLVTKDGRTFSTTDVDDKAAIRNLESSSPIWLGKHVLALQSDIPLALDLETLRVRPLANVPQVSLVCATADGAKAVLLTADGSALVADLGGQLPQ